MKKLLVLCIFLILICAVPATVYLIGQKQELRKKAAPASTLSLEPKSVAVKPGESFVLEAVLDTAENQVVALSVQLTFDPAKLEVQSIINGPMFPNVINSGVIDKDNASITVAAETTTPAKGKGAAVVMRFKALAVTSSPVQIAFSPSTFANSLGEGEENTLVGMLPASVSISDTVGLSDITPSPTDSMQSSPSATPSLSLPQSPESSPSPTQSPSPSPTLSEDPQPSYEPEAPPDMSLRILSPQGNDDAVAAQPVISGKAPPGSTITITIYSTPVTAVVAVDKNGNWSFTPNTKLASGPHTIVVTATDATTGQTYNATGSFIVSDKTLVTESDSSLPVVGNTDITILLIALSLILLTSGILLPIFIRW